MCVCAHQIPVTWRSRWRGRSAAADEMNNNRNCRDDNITLYRLMRLTHCMYFYDAMDIVRNVMCMLCNCRKWVDVENEKIVFRKKKKKKERYCTRNVARATLLPLLYTAAAESRASPSDTRAPSTHPPRCPTPRPARVHTHTSDKA